MMRFIKKILFGSGSSRVKILIFYSNKLKQKNRKKLQRIILVYLERSYGLYIHSDAVIAEDVFFPHPTSIVIGAGVTINNGVRIYQNVTLGGATVGDYERGYYPRVGSGTTIFAGAVLIGNIQVGTNCIIGANAVVNVDIPDNHIAVGVPCRLIKRNDI